MNASSVRSSATINEPPGLSMFLIALMTATGRDMSWIDSTTIARS